MSEEFQFVRGHLIDNLSVLEYHKRTVDMIKQIDEQIQRLGEEVPSVAPTFKNPREEASYLHNVKTLSVMKKQKERLIDKLNELQERIQNEIEVSKELTPLKPLCEFKLEISNV